MSSRVLVSLRVRGAPSQAFEVFTKEIGQWWRPNPLFQFTREGPGVLAFEPGVDGRLIETSPSGTVFEIGRVTAWEPGAKLGFTWRQKTFSAEQITHVEVRFEAVGDETRVTLEHRGWDSVPPVHVARHSFPDGVFLQRHGEWWQALLRSYQMAIG
jgi:hypothetical protein